MVGTPLARLTSEASRNTGNNDPILTNVEVQGQGGSGTATVAGFGEQLSSTGSAALDGLLGKLRGIERAFIRGRR